jgi:hypothetical protein
MGEHGMATAEGQGRLVLGAAAWCTAASAVGYPAWRAMYGQACDMQHASQRMPCAGHNTLAELLF